MKNIKLFGLFCLTLFACRSEMEVTSDYDQDADFSQYETFGIRITSESEEVPVEINPVAQRRIAKAIREEMELHGYTEVAKPDLLVSFYVKISQKKDVTSESPPSFRTGPYFYGPYWGYEVGMVKDNNPDKYSEATLIIDIVDAEKNQLVWFGTCTGAMKAYQDDSEFKLRAAINKIMHAYPFMSGSGVPIQSEGKK